MNDKDLVILGLACISACAQTGLEIQKKCLGQRLLEKLEELGYQVTPKQPEPKEWNDEGLPSVGTVCEIVESSFNCRHDKPSGVKVKVYSNFLNDEGVEFASYLSVAGQGVEAFGGVAIAAFFRPVRTEKEKLVEQAEQLIREKHQSTIHDRLILSPKSAAESLYDLGMLKQPDSK